MAVSWSSYDLVTFKEQAYLVFQTKESQSCEHKNLLVFGFTLVFLFLITIGFDIPKTDVIMEPLKSLVTDIDLVF